MKYFKALELGTNSLISWQRVAESYEELVAIGLDDDPLVLPENEVPDFLFNKCPLKIVDGELVERTEPEMSAFEDEFIVATAKKDFSKKIEDVNNETFTYDSHEFMMDEASRLFYYAIDKTRGNQKILTAAGVVYTLLDASTNIDDFLLSYHDKLFLTIKPAI